ncbi:GntR family transcriptional regulator [Shimia ponticola]|uniref:GntR family transcriptional regulator n=1 Tax=Shimia ponticola TaxID=2582893 RepID=UPI0011BF974D|nr:GntR family transcriptional regulator [Shimia ponticola]
MEHHGSLPKHLQISELLIREVVAGRLADGARLPPERDMAADLNVSVGTLRRALDRMTELGMLNRVQGSGNYVCRKDDAASVYAFFRLERPEGGGLPTARILSAQSLLRPDDLKTETGCSHVLRIRRVRLLDAEPVALEEIWLDAEGAHELTAHDLSESLYLTFQRDLGVAIARTEDRVGLGHVPDWDGALLNIAPGTPCAHVARKGWSDDLGLVEVSQTWFDASRAHYVSRNR